MKIYNIPVFSETETEADAVWLTGFGTECLIKEKDRCRCVEAIRLSPVLDTECPVIYGAGRTGRELADYFSVRQIPVYCFIDSDNHKDNQIINGIPVKNKDTIDRLPPGTSVIAAAADADEICREILSIRKDLKVFTHKYRFIYGHPFELSYGSLVLSDLGNLCLALKNRTLFVYGTGADAEKTAGLLNSLMYDVQAFLTESIPEDETEKRYCMPEEVLYYDRPFIVLGRLCKDLEIQRLESLGFRRYVDFAYPQCIRLHRFFSRESMLDINLGYTYKGPQGYPGITVIPAAGNQKETETITVALLGGSTTDETIYPFPSWGSCLWEKCHGRVTILNAGVNGYNSSAELLKLIRDVIPFKPDMVIVYDGFNDAWSFADQTYRFKMTYLNEVFQFASEHLAGDILGDVHRKKRCEPSAGIRENKTAFEMWMENIALMHAAASVADIDFYAFLQPCLGSKKKRDKEEEEICRMYPGDESEMRQMAEFRHQADNMRIESEYDYLSDLSAIFDQVGGVYMDICHVNEKGNRIIADEIYKRIQRLQHIHERG